MDIFDSAGTVKSEKISFPVLCESRVDKKALPVLYHMIFSVMWLLHFYKLFLKFINPELLL
ncbi:MAG: hypothetical protein A2277_02160 [Desulfobacterales bacterium RIFOXYA12_FULL_46_15]|nr:MAG: hypothetical protein A2277_02160 [Desulfobacterales bacterium RIFOXYA12_FULL_46_15]